MARRPRRPPRGESAGAGPPVVTAGLAAAGAGVPVALLAGLVREPRDPRVPHHRAPACMSMCSSAALWAGVLAAAGAGTGAYLEAARGAVVRRGARGGLTAYGWALGLLAVGVFVLATLEPSLTRAYVDGVTGPGGSRSGARRFRTSSRSRRRAPCCSRRRRGPASRSLGDGPILRPLPVATSPHRDRRGARLLPRPSRAHSVALAPERVPLVAAMLGGGEP